MTVDRSSGDIEKDAPQVRKEPLERHHLAGIPHAEHYSPATLTVPDAGPPNWGCGGALGYQANMTSPALLPPPPGSGYAAAMATEASQPQPQRRR